MKGMASFCLPLRIPHISIETKKLNDFNSGHSF